MPGDSDQSRKQFEYSSISHMVEKPSVIDEVLRNVFCPDCQYNLRGLSGNIVECPECGKECNITELVAIKWTKPWYRAPYFNKLSIPLFTGVLGLFAIPMTNYFVQSNQFYSMSVSIVFLIWMGSFYICYKTFDSIRGIHLALLMHVSFICYAAGIFGSIIGTFWAFTMFSGIQSKNIELWLLTDLLIIFCFMFVVWIARKTEKYVAYKCIDHYLDRIYDKSKSA